MNSIGRASLGLLALVALGATPQPHVEPHVERTTGVRPVRPPFVDGTRYDRFASNAIRRARLAYLLPARRATEGIAARTGGSTSPPQKTSYSVVNLDALIHAADGSFDPLALNNAGQIVGVYGASGYIVNPSGANAALVDPQCGSCYSYDFPTSISNNGRYVVGMTDNYFETYNMTYMNYGSNFWTLTGPTANTLSASDFMGGGLLSVANQGIAVAHDVYSSAGAFSLIMTANCPIFYFDANAINDSGVIVGASSAGAAVLTLGGCPTVVPNVDSPSSPDAITTNGDLLLITNAVGTNSGYSFWSKGRVNLIPLPSGFDASKNYLEAVGLNASDVVVENVVRHDGTPVGAFEYANGTSVDIQTLFPANSGWMSPLFVTGINDHGEIIGEGYLNNVKTSFALVPQ